MKNQIIVYTILILIFSGCLSNENPVSENKIEENPQKIGTYINFLPDCNWIGTDTLQVSILLAPIDFKDWNKIQFYWVDVYYNSIKIDSLVVKNTKQKDFYFALKRDNYNSKDIFAQIYTYIN